MSDKPGLAPDIEQQFEEQVISIDRVARVVKGGRRFRFRALVVVGDHKSKVGVGVSKGRDVQTAISKANSVARKNIISIPIYRGTIPHDAESKQAGSKVLLKPAGPGTNPPLASGSKPPRAPGKPPKVPGEIPPWLSDD